MADQYYDAGPQLTHRDTRTLRAKYEFTDNEGSMRRGYAVLPRALANPSGRTNSVEVWYSPR